MLGHVGHFWAGNFAIFRAILGHVGTILGSCWALLGSVLAFVIFVLDLGICVSFNFVHASLWAALLYNVFDAIFWLSFFFILGHAWLRLCLPDLKLMGGRGSMEHVQIQFRQYLDHVGHIAHTASFLPMLGASEMWARVGTVLGYILGHAGLCGAVLGQVGTVLGACQAVWDYFGVCVGLCLGLGHLSVGEFWSMQGVCTPYIRRKIFWCFWDLDSFSTLQDS